MAVDWDKHVLGPLAGVFAEPAEYIPRVGAPYAIEGIFDSAYKDVDLIDPQVDTTTTKPVIGVRQSIFRAYPEQNDKVRIHSVGSLFIVKEVRDDGHGAIKLMLADTGLP
ncbi:hypothetical protein L2Y94_05720 [Luteibacter aegosomatis]|uniref:head-tail joining protein n=1 Tax=Luteibacter aegosomatis TaxID=2911537 RepID=UPI001FFA886E|nr:hypothetical protein [Luteibacter aegosomatis]UPG86852.1 hypothetical protein L2Y94_05720 [Luteibacter aegosomatis]